MPFHFSDAFAESLLLKCVRRKKKDARREHVRKRTRRRRVEDDLYAVRRRDLGGPEIHLLWHLIVEQQ